MSDTLDILAAETKLPNHIRNCPVCRSDQVGVTDSRQTESTIRRRRRCGSCGHRWATVELTREQVLEAMLRVQQKARELADAIQAISVDLLVASPRSEGDER